MGGGRTCRHADGRGREGAEREGPGRLRLAGCRPSRPPPPASPPAGVGGPPPPPAPPCSRPRPGDADDILARLGRLPPLRPPASAAGVTGPGPGPRAGLDDLLGVAGGPGPAWRPPGLSSMLARAGAELLHMSLADPASRPPPPLLYPHPPDVDLGAYLSPAAYPGPGPDASAGPFPAFPGQASGHAFAAEADYGAYSHLAPPFDKGGVGAEGPEDPKTRSKMQEKNRRVSPPPPACPRPVAVRSQTGGSSGPWYCVGLACLTQPVAAPSRRRSASGSARKPSSLSSTARWRSWRAAFQGSCSRRPALWTVHPSWRRCCRCGRAEAAEPM